MGINCKAAIADGRGKFFIDEITVNNPCEDELLIQMKAAGICHTDYDSLNWGRQIILGHEGSGTVIKVGERIKDFQVGDPVILNWATPCGKCFQCLNGNQSICEINSPVVAGKNGYTPGHAEASGTIYRNKPLLRSFNLGTISEYTLVKSSAAVYNTSGKMSFKAASIISCGVMTGFGSVVNVARVKPGSSVVVIGAGGVGLNVIQGARISGAAKIIVIDINEKKQQMAHQFGATHFVLADKEDAELLKAANQVRQLTGGRGADYAFECTAIPALGAAPLAMVRNAGVAVQVSGIEEKITIDMNLFEWDKIYINPLYGKCCPQIDFPIIIGLYETGQLLLDEMITATYTLNDLNIAFDDLLNGRNAKSVIVF